MRRCNSALAGPVILQLNLRGRLRLQPQNSLATRALQTLEVRKNKDDYYAKSSVVDGVFKVDSSLGTALDKKIDDFQKKK